MMTSHKIGYIICLSFIFLFTFTISVFAAQTDNIFEISDSDNGSSQCQSQLLLKFITDYNPSLSAEQKETVCKTILQEADATGFDPFFISSIIAAESSFCPNAISPCRAFGLMQLTNCVSRAMHINNPFNIQENIYAGTRFLKYLQTLFSDNNLILAAYNAGPTRVARLGRIPRIRETICYVRKVNSLYLALHQQFFTLLKTSITRPIICRTINAIKNGATPIQIAFQTISPHIAPLENIEAYPCENERYSVLSSSAKKYSSIV